METYRSGDVCERCRWQIQRAIRSGRGRNFYTEVLKISGTATGHNGAPPFDNKLNIALHSHRSLTYMETYRSGHNGAHSKCVSPNGLVGSNPTVSAKDSLKVLSFKEFSLFCSRLIFCSNYGASHVSFLFSFRVQRVVLSQIPLCTRNFAKPPYFPLYFLRFSVNSTHSRP